MYVFTVKYLLVFLLCLILRRLCLTYSRSVACLSITGAEIQKLISKVKARDP